MRIFKWTISQRCFGHSPIGLYTVVEMDSSTNMSCSNGHKFNLYVDINGLFNNSMRCLLTVDLNVHSAQILLFFFFFFGASLGSALRLGHWNRVRPTSCYWFKSQSKMWLGSVVGLRPTIGTIISAWSSEQRAPICSALRLGHRTSVRQSIVHCG